MVLMLDKDTDVEVKLPGRYKVSPQIAGAIKAVPGVIAGRGDVAHPMIVETRTFKAPPGADWDDILNDARAVIPRWRANPDLLRKHFLLSDDGQECGGLYVWPTREAAEAAHDAAWRAAVEQRTGVAAGHPLFPSCRCCSTTRPGRSPSGRKRARK